ncbi:unnamed protein product [Effrenium voratum]|uniref:Uncharacterized protein n=1 Tax=Effrenium voratum TaxID=2562239 RepID=A0AA36IGD2_9DINO|nr:unnamed protein product [Effrenium voratum]
MVPEGKRGFGFACCATRVKPGSVEMPGPRDEDKRVIWDTANLSWWDFQRRRWRTLWLMRTVYFRYKNLQESAQRDCQKGQKERSSGWRSMR